MTCGNRLQTTYVFMNLIQSSIYLLNCNLNEQVFDIFIGKRKIIDNKYIEVLLYVNQRLKVIAYVEQNKCGGKKMKCLDMKFIFVAIVRTDFN